MGLFTEVRRTLDKIYENWLLMGGDYFPKVSHTTSFFHECIISCRKSNWDIKYVVTKVREVGGAFYIKISQVKKGQFFSFSVFFPLAMFLVFCFSVRDISRQMNYSVLHNVKKSWFCSILRTCWVKQGNRTFLEKLGSATFEPL